MMKHHKFAILAAIFFTIAFWYKAIVGEGPIVYFLQILTWATFCIWVFSGDMQDPVNEHFSDLEKILYAILIVLFLLVCTERLNKLIPEECCPNAARWFVYFYTSLIFARILFKISQKERHKRAC